MELSASAHKEVTKQAILHKKTDKLIFSIVMFLESNQSNFPTLSQTILSVCSALLYL